MILIKKVGEEVLSDCMRAPVPFLQETQRYWIQFRYILLLNSSLKDLKSMRLRMLLVLHSLLINKIGRVSILVREYMGYGMYPRHLLC